MVWNIWIIFPFGWEFHTPNWWSHIFQRGGSTTNQICFSRFFPSVVERIHVGLKLLVPESTIQNRQSMFPSLRWAPHFGGKNITHTDTSIEYIYIYYMYIYMLYVYIYIYIYVYCIYNQTMFALLFCQTRCVFLGGSNFLIRFLIAGRSCMRGRMPRATWSSEGCRHGLRRSGQFFTGDLGVLSWFNGGKP